MTELLAIPGWQTPPTTLAEWIARLEQGSGAKPVVERESPQGAWVEVGPLRLRGFAVLAGPHVEAINFELSDPDPAASTRFLEEAAAALGWEIHPDEPDDDDEDDDD
jgi:hypothetical protein